MLHGRRSGQIRGLSRRERPEQACSVSQEEPDPSDAGSQIRLIGQPVTFFQLVRSAIDWECSAGYDDRMINQLPPPSDRIANGQRADAEQLRLDAATLALRLAQWLEGPAPMLDDDTDYTRSAAVALRVMVDALAADDPHRAAAVLYDEAADDGSPMNGYLTTAACGGLYAGAIADLALEASDL